MVDREGKDINLEMAEALDGMDRTLSSENSDFLEKVLKALRNEKPISGRQEERLEDIYKKYFNEDGEVKRDEEDSDDIDEDDFV